MPIAQVQILQGRPAQAKEALIRAVTAAIVESLGVKPDSVRVILQEIAPEHWGIGGVTAKELGR
jgi:4-oxalocrotonate tautomerase